MADIPEVLDEETEALEQKTQEEGESIELSSGFTAGIDKATGKFVFQPHGETNLAQILFLYESVGRLIRVELDDLQPPLHTMLIGRQGKILEKIALLLAPMGQMVDKINSRLERLEKVTMEGKDAAAVSGSNGDPQE